MKRIVVIIMIFSLVFPQMAHAVEDPLKTPNNKFGMHILFTTEIREVASLINSSGGAWGYVTIPIQAHDKDMEKWQKFMNDARDLRLIPIIRIATENFYFNTHVWRKPTREDIIDFANFLDSLDWPTKNRYVIIFNEVNRADEWGGETNPEEYAELLSFAVTVFKSVNQDFFVISAGLDNAAPNEFPKYLDQYFFMQRMHDEVPGIFSQIDGIASHSYPNPGFIQPPSTDTPKSIMSFAHERALLSSFTSKKLPIFITETGWSTEELGEDTVASHYQEAFTGAWSDPQIVAVTPFIYRAAEGPFRKFSFLRPDGTPSKIHDVVLKLQKTKGEPKLVKSVLGTQSAIPVITEKRRFEVQKPGKYEFSISETFQNAFKWVMRLE